MAIVQNGTNKYIDHPIIVDAAGSTPFTTVASGITAAVGLGVASTTVFIKAGTYNEDLTLVSGVHLQGENSHTTIIDGEHTIPAAGYFKASNLKLAQTTPATAVFSEAGAGTCAIDVVDCIFNIHSDKLFNVPNSTGALLVQGCSDISPQNELIGNATGLCALTILDSTVGANAVAEALIYGSFVVKNSTLNFYMIHTYGAVTFDNSVLNCACECNTNTMVINNSTINSGAEYCVNSLVAASITLNNVVCDSTVIGDEAITGAGSVTLSEVTFPNTAKLITATTQDYATRVVSGSMQLDKVTCVGALYGATGVVTSTAAMTNGQLLVGSTGVAPVLATITAGAGMTVTNGAGSISVASNAPFDWVEVGVDGALVVNQGTINTKVALLTMAVPAVSAVGDTMILQGNGAGGWTITQAAAQQILIGNTNTTLGAVGTLSSSDKGDSVSLVCVTANLIWRVFGMVGNLTVV